MTDQPAPAAVTVDPNEERRAKRHRVLLRGHIGFNDNFVSVNCAIRNLSETGAMLVLEAPAAIPENFTLFAELSGFKVECNTAWHKGLALGVRFTSGRQPVKMARSQHLGTSQTALSEQTRKAMEIRDRRMARTEADGKSVVQPVGKTAAKPAFGRRIID